MPEASSVPSEAFAALDAAKSAAGRPLTKGEFRVGIGFNPSGDETVNAITRAAADLIDLVEIIPLGERGEIAGERGRLKALAQTHIEDAAMWAVKAATKA